MSGRLSHQTGAQIINSGSRWLATWKRKRVWESSSGAYAHRGRPQTFGRDAARLQMGARSASKRGACQAIRHRDGYTKPEALHCEQARVGNCRPYASAQTAGAHR